MKDCLCWKFPFDSLLHKQKLLALGKGRLGEVMGERGYRQSIAFTSVQYSPFIIVCPFLVSMLERHPTKSPVLLISNTIIRYLFNIQCWYFWASISKKYIWVISLLMLISLSWVAELLSCPALYAVCSVKSLDLWGKGQMKKNLIKTWQ